MFQTPAPVAVLPQPPRSNLQYMRQLDGLRALAVFAVWIAHWGLGDLRYANYVDWGWMGVGLFFVLSGFLITGILLRASESVEAAECGLGTAAKLFYIRRFLRIFPIYYLTLFVMAALIPEVRVQFPWYATYTTNIHFALHPIHPPVGGHFWSLAAEEQFYLVWPWIVLLVPRRFKIAVVLGLIASGAGLRIFLEMHHHRGIALGCVDQFGFGALLAMSGFYGLQQLRNSLLSVCKYLAVPILLVSLIYVHDHPTPIFSVIIIPIAATMTFTWLIGTAARGFTGLPGRVLESVPLVYLGRISYGLYIFHGFLIGLWARAGFAPMTNPWVQTLVFGLISVAVASISWYAIESPINSLKRYFQMPSGGHAGLGADVAKEPEKAASRSMPWAGSPAG